MLLSSNITIPLVAVYHVNSTLRGKFLLKFLKTGNSYTNRHGLLQITKMAEDRERTVELSGRSLELR